MNEKIKIFVEHHNLVDAFEEILLEHPQVDCPVNDFFCDGIYARQCFIPKGTVLTSKIHKTEHLYIVSAGRISVKTEQGEEIIEAPHTGVTLPNTRRILYALEDTIWTTFHANPNGETVEQIEERIIEKRDRGNISSHTKEIETKEELT